MRKLWLASKSKQVSLSFSNVAIKLLIAVFFFLFGKQQPNFNNKCDPCKIFVKELVELIRADVAVLHTTADSTTSPATTKKKIAYRWKQCYIERVSSHTGYTMSQLTM